MSTPYNPSEIESKWQKKWKEAQIYRSKVDWNRPKHYALTMLPYPSGDLHIGHWFAMTPSDARARFKRMQGYNVLFPMGFDAFGLPAENAAAQRNIHPWKWTYSNIERMRGQLKSMGSMFDWEREAISCTPEYYQWTEWFFEKFYEAGLAYRGEALVNWSPTLQTVLANEQVIDGKDERTGQPVVQKMMTQWFFEITHYAEELLEYPGLDWLEFGKLMQRNWIGRSEGANVAFTTETGDPLEIFTTRPDTLWGATFMVLAPEHSLVEKITSAEQRAAVEAYKAAVARTTEIERTAKDRAKTGLFTGGYATNPVNQARIPIWIADYVLSTYGSGAIMAVPAHDQRDFEFARKFGLPVVPVIQPEGVEFDGETMQAAHEGEGLMINSGPFDGTPATEEKGPNNPAIHAVTQWLEEKGIGRAAVTYRLRDWLISRQRYWGAPIPMIYRADGTLEAVPDEDLPVLLPEEIEFDSSGKNPLATFEPFLYTTDSQGRPARRETDTMDTFMCSSWYQYRYLSPHYGRGPFDPEEAAYWLPVDTYTGGSEHYNMHLLYTRFFTKSMRDLGMFEETAASMIEHGRNPENLFDEPITQLRNQGQILGEERQGDFIQASGWWEDGKLFATRIAVIDPGLAPASFDGVQGELVLRKENLLHVDTGGAEPAIVELLPGGAVHIPSIEGENTVHQLKHHLEIERMSKSKGNVVSPDELVEQYGADTVRGYLMFAFDWQKGGPWNSRGIRGMQRFLGDVWTLITEPAPAPSGEASAAEVRTLRRKVHQTIIRVTKSLEDFSFNTAMAALMELKNKMREASTTPVAHTPAWEEAVTTLLLLMAPFTPHIAEELWACTGKPFSIHTWRWPKADPEAAKEEVIVLPVQVNGKLRDRLELPAGFTQAEAEAAALASETVQKFLEGKKPRKVIVVPGKLVNIVV